MGNALDPDDVDADGNFPLADWRSHHIEGYARAAGQYGDPNAYFAAPLISHVTGNLWQGGCKSGVRLPDDFKTVISLYPWERYDLGPDTVRHEVTMYDSADLPDMTQLAEIVDTTIKAVHEGKTLVHCQAGLNRSALVAALAILKDSHETAASADDIASAMTADQVITLLREKRSPLVLCNKHFERYLRSLDA